MAFSPLPRVRFCCKRIRKKSSIPRVSGVRGGAEDGGPVRGQLPVSVVSFYAQPGTPARHMEGDRPVLLPFKVWQSRVGEGQ